MAKSSGVIENPQHTTSAEVSLMVELEEQAHAVLTREQIEQRAYAIYLHRGCADGLDVQDWLQAESELLAEAEDAPQAKLTTA